MWGGIIHRADEEPVPRSSKGHRANKELRVTSFCHGAFCCSFCLRAVSLQTTGGQSWIYVVLCWGRLSTCVSWCMYGGHSQCSPSILCILTWTRPSQLLPISVPAHLCPHPSLPSLPIEPLPSEPPLILATPILSSIHKDTCFIFTLRILYFSDLCKIHFYHYYFYVA